ncbi:hypothetical protein [Xenorhabdus griffiniae]|uniref:Uncharacterized protein n=1 Tax=Xenorhabdus griffiniae TaxID=351672 RepID=A0ABY9XCY2_9GAMM|nr:hypothetical protein [Xenorhabdus griffiniae]MBD1229305.1 hypothetical protein [Xenorhabdus griffiniae]MBE8587270.1 hypothetical protein [Xenorhabdus griffiniae]WMV70775.1 hypothetical protein QL128_11060 [Xenorhabdus griffiniae]WNH00451.1 hypothetical protein QL112_011065 [Xenorhabdus griffiniae]
MRPITPLLLLSSILIAPQAIAVTEHENNYAKRCLDYGIKEMRKVQADGALSILGQASVDNDSIQLNVFSDYVGSQYVATELVADIKVKDKKEGEILCLGNDDQFFYFHFSPR